MYKLIFALIISFLLFNTSAGQEREVSGTKIYNSLKNLDDSKAKAEYNRRKAGFRLVITTLPSGSSLNVGPVIVSQDRRYVRLSVNPWFSSIKSIKTFTFRR